MISSMAAPSSYSSSSWFLASSSVVVRVEKATSEFLMGPDWTMNIEICDIINSNHWVAKEVVKSVKRRLLNKNPKVQLLSLTLLETMVKNCVDIIHIQIAERSILPEMVKIVKKTMDTRVRDKILVLIDSWREAFGGPGGKYPQYYWAFQELKNAGVGFPPRSRDSAPIFTPPVSHLARKHPQIGYKTPTDPSIVPQTEVLSFPTITSMRGILNLLAEMLQAVNPSDGPAAVKDEVIVDLVDRCRANHKKLLHMLTTTGDADALAKGLELNDALQSVLAKHDAISSGTVFPVSVKEIKHESTESLEVGSSGAGPSNTEQENEHALVPVPCLLGEEEDEDDDFAQLSQRHSKTGEGELSDPPSVNNALVLRDPPVRTKEQDMIDLLTITLSSNTSTEPIPETQDTINETPLVDSYPGGHQNNYIATWAAQPQPQMQPQIQTYSPPQYPQQPQYYYELQPQPQYPQYYGYTSQHYAPTPGYYSNSYASFSSSSNAFPAWGNNNGIAQVGVSSSSAGQKQAFVPSYRLFEDLNVLSGNGDQPFKTTTMTGNSSSTSLYGANTQSLIGGRK
ncbi:unnamed protein product [Cuscuta epithymum]|uniref:Uncharacterized protein n=1 Tax=Cuscuta epithymum TaxID=186058 RepID=A0AAV0G2M1_9ASTE|nr:unnamed protein product [Cuscuta epithymum]